MSRVSCSVDYDGREAFLHAAEREWLPRPLTALLDAVPAVMDWLATLPAWQQAWQGDPFTPGEAETWFVCSAGLPRHLRLWFPPERRAELRPFSIALAMRLSFQWRNVLEDASPEAAAARRALESWRSLYPVAATDSWFLDAAIQTVAYAVYWEQRVVFDPPLEKMPLDLRWAYCPEGRRPSEFNPRIKHPRWRSAAESPAAFKRRVTKDFQAQLADYVKQVKRQLGKAKTHQDRDAEWTARYLGGEPIVSIAKGDEAPSKDPYYYVRRAVERFALRIGLTLPGKLGTRLDREPATRTIG